ncbi:MAG: ABC transporter permease [Lentisphaerae bacterium]|nr:ABC transporter permease [Lentisphaerota bacterium]
MKRDMKSLIGPYLALAVLLIACCISDEHFRSAQNLLNITRQVSYSGLIALGMTFVIAAGGIDLSVGSILAMTGVLSILGMNLLPPGMESLGVLAAFGISAGAGIAAGAVNGFLVSLGKIPPFIATLGTLSIFRSLALYFADAGMVSSNNNMYRQIGSFELLGIPLPTIVLIVFTILFAILLRNTRFGRHVCAVGSNEKVAFYSAIPTGRIKFYTYMLIGFAAGVSAFLFGSRLNSISSTSAGAAYELDAIAAVIIGGSSMSGGKASITGTFAGILILGIVSNVLDMWGISINLQGLVKGLVILVAVLIQRVR